MNVMNEAGMLVRTMTVPSSVGLHRVNWDLRHTATGQQERWRRFENQELARPIGTRGPWVSPSSYTVSIEARDTSASTPVEVRGDPEMPLTLSMYQSREYFMLGVLELTAAIQNFMDEQDVPGVGRGGLAHGTGRAPATTQAKLQNAVRTVEQVYGTLNARNAVPTNRNAASTSAHGTTSLRRRQREMNQR